MTRRLQHGWLVAWLLFFVAISVYVAWRMQAFALAVPVVLPDGVTWLPNTFASVDHPFHVARADTLWRELGQGSLLRWIGQHQGGYPVEFYPLGEAWLEVGLRAASLGRLTAEGAHTLAVILLFLLPAAGFLALARLDSLSPGVALLALALQVALPGGWYHGGYTELVQWGLVTNVAGATAAFLMLPAMVWFCRNGRWPALALAVACGAAAIYSNPRSLIGVAALAVGVLLSLAWPGEDLPLGDLLRRMVLVAAGTALLTAPQVLSLLRFGDLYTFVHYSGYEDPGSYLAASISAVTPLVLALAVAGCVGAFLAGTRWTATRAAASSLGMYVILTAALSFFPALASAASQLETTRLMPLQRFLTLYLAAAGCWWIATRALRHARQAREAILVLAAIAVVITLTRPPVTPLDPASPAVPPVSLYPVAMSAQPVQADLRTAIVRADAAAEEGTSLLVLGSALSWHQALWAPLWTERPLYYDNWLWYWHPDHAGTPGYRAGAGNHYPDPEQTLTSTYLEAHGIGGVIVTGPAAQTAAASPLLESLGGERYQAYRVRDPRTTITFGGANATQSQLANQRLAAYSASAAETLDVRANWFPRWSPARRDEALTLHRTPTGTMALTAASPVTSAGLVYEVQPLDWMARTLAAGGLLLVAAYAALTSRRVETGYHAASRPDDAPT